MKTSIILITLVPDTQLRTQTEMLKKVMAMLTSKYLSVKAKIRAIETRLIIHSLLMRDKKIIRHLFQQHRTYLGPPNTVEDDDEDYHQSHDIAAAFLIQTPNVTTDTIIENTIGAEENGEYQDFEHSSFSDNQMEDYSSSVMEMVKNDKGQEFTLENDIDRVADLFIQRFHQQIRLQKLQPESPIS